MVLTNKLDTLYGAELPAEALSQALEAQRKALVEAALDKMEFNKRYVVELRQEYYEDPANNRQGYKGAVSIEECDIVRCEKCLNKDEDDDLIKRSDAIKAINSVGWLEDAEYEEKILAIPTIEPKQCEKIIKAIDAIDDFLIKYSEFWNDITWRSNIDGHELYVDWGYFEEGMREIKNYCKQLNGQKWTK